MTQASTREDLWVRRYHSAPDSPMRLVCLPHAGGSSTFYFPVSKALSPAVEVLAVQYPGRQDRLAEPGIESLPELADRIFEALQPFTDRPLALFGHSMGAVLAHELALRMRDAGLPDPVRLFVSGRRAPSCRRDEDIRLRSDAGILDELKALHGTDESMLNDPDVLDMIMPAIRSDYRAVETYQLASDGLLSCPVTVLTGDDDPRVAPAEADLWREYTTGETDLHVFPGGHFFLADRAADVVSLVADRLAAGNATTAVAG
ncbi:thioesterase II family protein [Streptomyces tanashiensis]|uniref:thioesterase II family protein n=1 Tax=Streptomyces tanashiensis TaxID=67367 RepID=UPI0033E50855